MNQIGIQFSILISHLSRIPVGRCRLYFCFSLFLFFIFFRRLRRSSIVDINLLIPHIRITIRIIVSMSNVVTLDYNRLVAGDDLSEDIGVAFGVDGLGILTVANVPTWEEKRRALLPLARQFADLPESVKEKYEHPQSYYSFGWSHGKVSSILTDAHTRNFSDTIC